jgi:hypothetical protein
VEISVQIEENHQPTPEKHQKTNSHMQSIVKKKASCAKIWPLYKAGTKPNKTVGANAELLS